MLATAFQRFVVLGVGLTALHFLVYTMLLRLGFQPAFAAAAAFFALIPVSFILHGRATFRYRDVSLAIIGRYLAALAGIGALNAGLVETHVTYFGIPALLAQAVALILVVPVTFVVFRMFVFTDGKTAEWGSVSGWLGLAVAVLALYYVAVCVLAYANPVLLRDEWRHHWDYLRLDLLDAILRKQNGHVIWLSNLAFVANFLLLDDRPIWLVAFGLAIVATAAGVVGWAYARIRWSIEPVAALLGASVVVLCFVWATGKQTLFWSIGVHNHLAVGGAVLALASTCLHRSEVTTGRIAFAIVCSFAASISFSGGLAVWVALAFAVAVQKSSARHLVLVLAAAGATIGVLLAAPGRSLGSELPTPLALAQFVAAFIGAPVIELLPRSTLGALRISVSTAVGGIALAACVVLSVLVWRFRELASNSDEKRRIWQCLNFACALMWFAVAVGVLVAAGRFEAAGMSAALAPRFSGWTASFWAGALISGLAWLTNGRESRALGLFKLVALMLALAAVSQMVEARFRDYNREVRSALALVANATDSKEFALLWRADRTEILERVSERLRSERKNVFANGWAGGFSNIPAFVDDTAVGMCSGRMRRRSSAKQHEFYDGVASGVTRFDPLKELFVVARGRIVGIGLPTIGEVRHHVFSRLPAPFRNQLLVDGNFALIVETDHPSEDRRYYGRSVKGRLCSLEVELLSAPRER